MKLTLPALDENVADGYCVVTTVPSVRSSNRIDTCVPDTAVDAVAARLRLADCGATVAHPGPPGGGQARAADGAASAGVVTTANPTSIVKTAPTSATSLRARDEETRIRSTYFPPHPLPRGLVAPLRVRSERTHGLAVPCRGPRL